MDAAPTEHSDSDSGDSWILLEEQVHTVADDAPGYSDHPHSDREIADNIERDEDTDGISIISDSDPESLSTCELINEKSLSETHFTEPQLSQYTPVNALPTNNNHIADSTVTSDDVFLGDNHKLKTYVHKRNKRLSTVLNIIVLGSVITAAGVAIGHMWGVRDDCTLHSTPSVNKILSNLYKLQEENAYLRNIIKELTQNVNNFQINQQKQDVDKFQFKQKCKKVFEESLTNKNINKFTKCIDNHNVGNILQNQYSAPEYERQFIDDVNKLKNVYKQNRSWLDGEVARRLHNEETLMKAMKIDKPVKDKMIKKRKTFDNTVTTTPLEIKSTTVNVTGPSSTQPFTDFITNEVPEKVSYADSLKGDSRTGRHVQTRSIATEDKINKHDRHKRKPKKDNDSSENISSEEDYKKDDRHLSHKYKQERKKQDRQKLHKKQKRRNKYEQWEMKGGYLKDLDEFSITSSQDYDSPKIVDDDPKLYVDSYAEPEEHAKSFNLNKIKNKQAKINNSNKEELNWFDKRASIRTQARKKLEQELFGDNTPNNAGWYFRRMQKREQCRTKGDNSTVRKLSKRKMMFKRKH